MTTNDIIEIEDAAPGLRGTYKVMRATAKAVLLKAEGSVVEFWAPRSIFKAIKSEVGGYVYPDWFTLPRWFRPQIKGV